MQQTEKTAIVLHAVNYRENDRMLTLFSPTRGRIDAMARGCRKPKSPILNASEIFALGDYQLYEKSGRYTVVSASLIETFFALREDYDRLICGTYLLGMCNAVIQEGQPAQDLFSLLLHTLSRLTFTDQEWRPLLCGFLVHFAYDQGIQPRLRHCMRCGERIADIENAFFDLRGGGVVCRKCHTASDLPISSAQRLWLMDAQKNGSATWVNTPEKHAPFGIMRKYVELQLGSRLRSGLSLPED
ncbi:MAG: DNA repair protein RecO [Clostridia bacterium]|nr:DNA repair protein RecO [Clostridia bacterium]MBR1686361.1 DNA repair protein RecO [Clostridia bacterium]